MRREMEQSSAPPKGSVYVDEKGWNLDINPYSDLQRQERSLMSIEREKTAKRRNKNSPKNAQKYGLPPDLIGSYQSMEFNTRSSTKLKDFNFSSDLLQIKPVLPPRRLGFAKHMQRPARSLSDESKDSRLKVKEEAMRQQRFKNIEMAKKRYSNQIIIDNDHDQVAHNKR